MVFSNNNVSLSNYSANSTTMSQRTQCNISGLSDYFSWPGPGASVQNLICPTCLFKCVYPSTTNMYPYLTGGSLDRSSLVFARENVKFANIWQGTLISIAYMALCHLLSVITLHKFAFRICIRSSRCSKCSNAQFCTMQTREAGWAVPCG